MNRRALILLVIPALAAAQRHREPRSWPVEDREKIDRSFTLSAGGRKLLVDNISGFIHVTGAAGSQVQISVEKHIGADSSAALADAKRDVKLDISQEGNLVRLYVDGPFRDRNGGHTHDDYRVTFDYEIQVPYDTEVSLKNIAGAIEVRNTTGDFTIVGVSGGIDASGLAGAGTIRTVSGAVKAAFAKNPSKPCEFRTVNGSVDVYFQPPLNADLDLHTVSGGVFSDFDVTTRPVQTSGQNVNGRFLYRVDHRKLAARAGSGGPELKLNTVNGAIRLHSKGL